MRRVLVTGFGPFDGPRNSSQELIQSFQADPPTELQSLDLEVQFEIFPVDTEAIGTLLQDSLERTRPEVCLLLGQARRTGKVEIEEQARNLRRFQLADVRGRRIEDEPVLAGAPEAYSCSLGKLPVLAERLREAGIPARLSQDAGLYLCNQVYFLALHHAAQRQSSGEGLRVAFVHLPVLPEQRRPGDAPETCLGLGELRRVLVVLLRVVGFPLASEALSKTHAF